MKKDDLGYIREKSKSGNVAIILILVVALGIAGGLTAIKTTEDLGNLAAAWEQPDQDTQQHITQK
ncbi:MAG: hypothetical protein HFG80_00575 [Eubacterium sp.]|jgi:hypothetical protein|nr:hypothetical protein [Eubacterium sp.]